MSHALLIVEDEMTMRESLLVHFRAKGFSVFGAPGVEKAREIFARERLDLVLMDIHLSDGSGLELLREFRSADDQLFVVMITAYPDVGTAVEAMREGAYDYLPKPFDLSELDLMVERTLETKKLRKDVQRLSRATPSIGEGIIAESPGIKKALELAAQVSMSPNTHVLVRGETGTGKEVVAEAIHRKGPLVKVNCSALPAALIESELFGHEKGAFTDAREPRMGLFELAEGGTLFLDEISEMKPELQSKLLRVVEGQPFRRIGGKRDINVDLRVVAATHRDLEKEVSRGTFREDLYYRLKVFVVEVPPLRDRMEDIIPLARLFAERHGRGMYENPPVLSEEAEQALVRYQWPGNVRELRNMMERAVILCGGETIGIVHLPTEVQVETRLRSLKRTNFYGDSITLAQVEKLHIQITLEESDKNKSEAARRLGISRKTLREKMKLWGEADPEHGRES